MTTSNSTNFSVNRDHLITGALRILGVVAQGESPTDEMVREASEALNMMIKAWQADGMPLWAIKEYNVTLTASDADYRIGTGQSINTPKPLKILSAFFHNGTSNVDIPMILLTRQQYNMLGNKTSEGQPSQFYYDVQNDYGDLYVFPVPDTTAADASNYVRIVYQRPYEDFDSNTDTPDFPQEWYDAIKFGLASRLAAEYGLTLENQGYLRKMAQEIKQEALNFGLEEGSIYFGVERRSW